MGWFTDSYRGLKKQAGDIYTGTTDVIVGTAHGTAEIYRGSRDFTVGATRVFKGDFSSGVSKMGTGLYRPIYAGGQVTWTVIEGTYGITIEPVMKAKGEELVAYVINSQMQEVMNSFEPAFKHVQYYDTMKNMVSGRGGIVFSSYANSLLKNQATKLEILSDIDKSLGSIIGYWDALFKKLITKITEMADVPYIPSYIMAEIATALTKAMGVNDFLKDQFTKGMGTLLNGQWDLFPFTRTALNVNDTKRPDLVQELHPPANIANMTLPAMKKLIDRGVEPLQAVTIIRSEIASSQEKSRAKNLASQNKKLKTENYYASKKYGFATGADYAEANVLGWGRDPTSFYKYLVRKKGLVKETNDLSTWFLGAVGAFLTYKTIKG
jgi:hypothetical protein